MRLFLWTGSAMPSKRALVAWDLLCRARCAGGLNIKNLVLWNKAAIYKQLWALTFKKDKLWREEPSCKTPGLDENEYRSSFFLA